jgi:M6 family metalloprotease-like protein
MDWDTATSHTYSNLYGIYFPVLRNWNYVVSVSDTGFAVGESRTILKTEDAGRSWTVVDSGGAYALHAVYFAVYDTGSGYGKERDTVVSDTGIAVGESGTILRTTDGGDTWDSVVCETGRDLHDVVTTNVIREYNWLGHDFTWDILLKADEIINFADYDRDGDDTVDMLFLIDPTRGGTSYGGLALEHWFTTNDTSSSGRPIRILSNANSPSATVLAPNRNGVVAVCVHEYAHSLGLDDYYDFRRPTAGRGIGGFEAMSDCSGFKGIVSPFNPWFRSKHGGNHGPFNWLDLIPVTRPQYGQPIQDITTGEAYEVVSGPYPETATSGQRFLVTNHQGLSFWEQNWPRTGLMIWHIDPEAKILSGGDSRYKKVDLEAPHGLWDWDFEEWTPTFPNPVLGIDSLDVADADTAWRSKFDGFGSPTCMFRVGIDSTFDALTNPSSDNYNSDSSLFAAHSQNVASHVAVKNMYLDTIYPTIVHADLLPNWVESDRVVATAENNGRRWLLGPDEQAMHLVYVSKGYIYYTTTDSSKLWLPAVPIGEGSYPSLGLDTSGDPCVVWIQQGDCSTTNAKLLFSRKTNGSWTSPVTLLSIFAGLGPPSLVVDNGDTSSRCLYGRVMYPHTVAQHLHILRAIQDHRSELHADVAGRF